MDNGKRLLLGQLPRPRPRRHPPRWSRGSDSLLLPIPSELLRSPRHTPPPPHQGRPRLRLDGSCWALGCAPRHRESNSGRDGQRLLRRRSGCQRFGAKDDLTNAKGVKTQEVSSRRRALQLRTKRASQGGVYASPELVCVAQHGDKLWLVLWRPLGTKHDLSLSRHRTAQTKIPRYTHALNTELW